MAAMAISKRLCIAAALIVAFNICVVESLRFRRPFTRGGSQRFSPPRFGTEGSGRQRDSGLPRPPPLFRQPEPEVHAHRVANNKGDWLKQLLKQQANANRNPNNGQAPAAAGISHPPKKRPIDKRIGPFTVNVIETIKLRKDNNTRYQAIPTNQPRNTEETATNQATTPLSKTRPNRRAFTADEAKVPCGGPNEAGQWEECYRFSLSTDLNNNSVISGALVLLPAGNGFSVATGQFSPPEQGTTTPNINIVAKFPTSGEDAFRESISAQNISFDNPSWWQSASLHHGASLITRALREGSKLFLKMSVITESDGRPVTSNYIPLKSDMLPVLIVDIEVNGTEPSTPADTPRTSRITHENVVGRLRNRRTLETSTTRIHNEGGGTPSTLDESALGHIICTGSTGCCQRSITIDFRNIVPGIIAPLNFTTNVCFGSCKSNPTGSINRDSSYTEVLHFVLQGIRSGVPYASCLPSLTGDLSLLMFDDEYNVVYAQLRDFVVVHCGCVHRGIK